MSPPYTRCYYNIIFRKREEGGGEGERERRNEEWFGDEILMLYDLSARLS